jgi:hypothetical protein
MAYYRGGYNFRVKTVESKQYLSARKGSDERGLGPLTSELRDFIDRLKRSRGTPDESKVDELLQQKSDYLVSLHPTPTYPTLEMTEFSREEMERALFDIGFERARVKTRDCFYSLNGYCQYWRYLSKSPLLRKIYLRFVGGENAFLAYPDLQQAGRQDREMVRVTELLCFECDKYYPRNKGKKTV